MIPTKKVITEARRCFESDMDRRATRAARILGQVDRASQDKIDADLRALPASDAAALVRRGVVAPRIRETACLIGETYHANVAPLYASSRARVAYGPGGVEDKSWPYKGSRKSFPAVWHDAGARWVIRDRAVVVELENSRGCPKSTIKLAQCSLPTLHVLQTWTTNGWIPNQLWSILTKSRYGMWFTRQWC